MEDYQVNDELEREGRAYQEKHDAPDFKSFKEIEKINRSSDYGDHETKIMHEKHGDRTGKSFESISWGRKPQSKERGQWQHSVKVKRDHWGAGISIEVSKNHPVSGRVSAQSFELGKSEVDMLLRFLESVKGELRDYNGDFVPTTLEKY